MRANPAFWAVIIGGFALSIGAQDAYAERQSYDGGHPIADSRPGQFCYIEVVHTHNYTPDSAHKFARAAEGGLQFTGDPTQYGFEGPLLSFEGQHPARFERGVSTAADFCDLTEAHFHLQVPLNPEEYEERKGVFYFGSYRDFKKVKKKAKRDAAKLRRAERKERRRQRRQDRKARR